MQEENQGTRKNLWKYGLSTKCTYSAGTGNRTLAQLCTAPGKNYYATCFPRRPHDFGYFAWILWRTDKKQELLNPSAELQGLIYLDRTANCLINYQIR